MAHSGFKILTGGLILLFSGITPGATVLSQEAVPAPCDMTAYAQAEAAFNQLYDQSLRDPASVPPEQLQQAAWTLVLSQSGCSDGSDISAQEGPIVIDEEIFPDGMGAQFGAYGVKWGNPALGTPGGTVTFSFMPANVTLDLDNNVISRLIDQIPNFQSCFYSDIRAAFVAWSSIANIDFREVADNGAIQSSANATGQIRIGAHPFDSSSTLAHAFPPFPGFGTGQGDIHFNSARTVFRCAGGVDVGLVAMHEIGHAIGLDHSTAGGAIMQPIYDTYARATGLQPDDIAGGQQIYGWRYAPPNVNLVRGGNFDSSTDQWLIFGPVTRNFSGGVMRFYATTNTTGASIFQDINYSGAAGAPFGMAAQIGNESNIPKNVSLSLRNQQTWTGALTCNFTIPPKQPLLTYQLVGKLPTHWGNIRVEIGVVADNTPQAILDTLFVKYRPDLSSLTSLQCVAPAPPCPGDINGDKTVSILDVQSIAGTYGSSTGLPRYNAAYDINADGQINILDLQFVAGNFGKTCQ